jgi:hypothetical protein
MTTPIAPHITAFFEQRLPKERGVSENTSNSYAYAFQLLLTFASKRFRVSPSQLAVEQIDAPLVLDFLNDLETTRGNGPSSRNIRLAAIRSFMHFLEYRVPSAIEQIRRILGHSPTSPARACPPCGLWPSRTGLGRQTKACWRSPGSRACCFSACAGSQTTQDRTATRDLRGCRIAFLPLGMESAP